MYNPKRLVNTDNSNTTCKEVCDFGPNMLQKGTGSMPTVLTGDLLDRRQDAGFDVIGRPL